MSQAHDVWLKTAGAFQCHKLCMSGSSLVMQEPFSVISCGEQKTHRHSLQDFSSSPSHRQCCSSATHWVLRLRTQRWRWPSWETSFGDLRPLSPFSSYLSYPFVFIMQPNAHESPCHDMVRDLSSSSLSKCHMPKSSSFFPAAWDLFRSLREILECLHASFLAVLCGIRPCRLSPWKCSILTCSRSLSAVLASSSLFSSSTRMATSKRKNR